MKTPLLNPEIYNKVNDSATSRDKITRDIKGKLQAVSPLLYKSLRLNNTMFTEIQRNKKVKFANLQEKILNTMQNQTHPKIIYLMKKP